MYYVYDLRTCYLTTCCLRGSQAKYSDYDLFYVEIVIPQICPTLQFLTGLDFCIHVYTFIRSSNTYAFILINKFGMGSKILKRLELHNGFRFLQQMQSNSSDSSASFCE